MPKPYATIGEATEPDKRIRIEWGQALAEQMKVSNVDVPTLKLRLWDGFGIKVSRQAIECWLSGDYAPRPHVQAALGTVFGVPARLLFRIENAPAKGAA